MPEINAQEVFDKLGKEISSLSIRNALLEVQLESLIKANKELTDEVNKLNKELNEERTKIHEEI